MKYVLIALVIFSIASAIAFYKGVDFSTIAKGAGIIILGYAIVLFIDYSGQTSSTEIWSGRITKVKHIEEWDEWIPPRTETYTERDSKGNTVTKTRTIPGYWIHHDAENHITTSDRGTFQVYKTPDGKRLTDYFVNSTKELESYFPIGSATASTHQYTNKIKSSYSIFKHKDIDLDDYPDLFEYPTKTTEYLSVNRLLGPFKDKENKSKVLDNINSDLNDTSNPSNKDSIKGYKQVNLMLVNFGDKSEDYGYALQDYWQNGAKNDLVVTFGTDSTGKPTWCYVFSWSEVEILKTDIRELVMSVDNINEDYNDMINSISKLVEEKFQRREFAEFDYIQVEPGFLAKVFLVIILIGTIIFLFIA